MIAERFNENDNLPINEYNTAFDDEINDDVQASPIIQKISRTKDKSITFLKAQIVICSIAIIISLALKMIGGYYYNYAKNVFNECFNEPINKAQVLGVSQARAVLAAQSTVYGMGGESADESVRHLESKNELSEKENAAILSVNKMALPTQSRTVTCEYGSRIHPITGKQSFHTGIDIGEDMNMPIYSVLSGKVRKVVKDDDDYGNYVIITHSNGVETMYAHCSSVLVKSGQSVNKGQVIAKIGTTGLSTGPHLHFEVRINDTRLNPRWFINL